MSAATVIGKETSEYQCCYFSDVYMGIPGGGGGIPNQEQIIFTHYYILTSVT